MYIITSLLFTHVNMQIKNTKCTESTQAHLQIHYITKMNNVYNLPFRF